MRYIKKELYKLARKEVAALPEKYKLPIYMYYTGGLKKAHIGLTGALAILIIVGGAVN